MSDAADGEILNDRWHTAVHEEGHSVVGRVLGMLCGPVSIVADDDEIRAVAGLAPPLPDGPMWLAWQAASAELDAEPVRIPSAVTTSLSSRRIVGALG